MTEMRCGALGCENLAVWFGLVVARDGAFKDIACCEEHKAMVPYNDSAMTDRRHFGTRESHKVYEECRLRAVLFEYHNQTCALILKAVRSGLAFFLPAGYQDASWVLHFANRTPHAGIPTHQLIVNMIREFGGTAEFAVVHDYYYSADRYGCRLNVATPAGDRTIECRVCDAVAISLLTNIPLRIDTAFLGEDPIMI